MKTKILLFLMAIAASSASARIGDTPEQCQQRYGAPYKSQAPWTYYKKSGFILMVSFYEGKVDCISYRKVEENALGKGVDISDNEIDQLLKLNAGQATWKKRRVISMDREWQTEDDSLSAFYKTFDNFLSIATKGFYDRANVAKKAKENKALQGF